MYLIAFISKQEFQISKLEEKSQTYLHNERACSEQLSAMQFQLSTHKLEIDDINAKYTTTTSRANYLQRELDDAKNKQLELNVCKSEFTNLLNRRDEEIEEIKHENEGLKNEKKSVVTENVDTLQEIVKDRNEKQRNLTIILEENKILRDQILKVTQQKVHLYNRAEDLENELEKFMLGRWQDENVVRDCQCGTTFYTSLRKHHCRSCGRVLCHYCVNNRVLLPNSPTPVRVCNGCFKFRESFKKAPHASRDIVNSSFAHDLPPPPPPQQNTTQSLDNTLEANHTTNNKTLQDNTFENSSQSQPSIIVTTNTPSSLENPGNNSVHLAINGSTQNKHENSKIIRSFSGTHSSETKKDLSAGDYSQRIIPIKKTHSFDVIVTTVGTNIKWEFSSDRGIIFQLSYKSSSISTLNVDEEVIIPRAYFDNNGRDREIHIGEYITKKVGIYYFTFTNDSNFRQKRLSYKMILINPSE